MAAVSSSAATPPGKSLPQEDEGKNMENITVTNLWDILGIPPPENSASQHHCRRVVLLGRPYSGKRTISRRLRYAAELQYPQREGSRAGEGIANALSADEDERKKGLYNPKEGETDDLDEKWNFTGDSANRVLDLDSHGIGVSHDFVVQRVPSSVTGIRTTETTLLLRGIRRTTEFFCCDTAGSLAIALPSIESLKHTVVLVVVDFSDPASVGEQIRENYAMLRTHISAIFKKQLPQQDKVRYLQAVDDRVMYWKQEATRLNELRDRVFPQKSLSSEVEWQPAEDSSAVRSLLIATKTDVCDKLIQTYEGMEDSLKDDPLLDTLIPYEIRELSQRSSESITKLLSDYARFQAISHFSAHAAISSRLNTIAGIPSDGVTALVHPFYRGLWGYISRLLDETSGSHHHQQQQQNKEFPESTVNICDFKFYPASFLPFGLDNLAYLNSTIASGGFTLPNKVNVENDTSNIPLQQDNSPEIADLPLPVLHQDYLQQMNHAASPVMKSLQLSAPSSSMRRKTTDEDAKMIWDIT